MPSTSLEEKRAKIKFWLALAGMTRKEFSEILGVHITSLHGWLSNKAIPQKRWNEIKGFFETKETLQPEEPEIMRAVAVGFSSDELKELKEAAGDIPLDLFLREAALARMKQILKNGE